MRKVTISVPATSANLGPGFDCLGMALNLRHQVTFIEQASPGLQIMASGEDAQLIPRDQSNLVYQSMQIIFRQTGAKPDGLAIIQHNQIPIASGLGSSSSAVLAGLFGANEFSGSPYTREQLLQMASDLEGHPDNVAPAVYGGLVLGIQSANGLIVEQIDMPPLQAVVVLPEFDLLTETARAVLPRAVSTADAIFNSSRLGLLIRALQSGNYSQLSIAMQDRLHQPYRVPLIPGMQEAMTVALEAGAAGVALSGAGPSLIAFASRDHVLIAETIAAAFHNAGLDARHWLLQVDRSGTEVLRET